MIRATNCVSHSTETCATVTTDPVPRVTIEIEELRERLLADRGTLAGNGAGTVDSQLARAMAAGVPAAWALFQDVVRPRLVSAAVAVVDDPKRAVEIADATCADLYRQRADRGRPGLSDLPVDVTLFQFCRAETYRRILGDAATSLPDDPIGAARSLTGGDARFTALAQLDSRQSVELRGFSLPDQLARQRPDPRDTRNTVRILNLPAVLTLAFVALIVIASFFILEQPTQNRTQRAAARLEEAVRERQFDEATRLLADNPPPGMERLEPVRPESRIQRIRELKNRPIERPKALVVSPIGKIDSVRPVIRLSLADVVGEYKLRIIESATGVNVMNRTFQREQSIIEIESDLQRGSIYTISVESPQGSIRSQFEIMTDEERAAVEARIAAIVSLVDSTDPIVLIFLRAHVYRSEDCLVASLEQWRALAEACPESQYAREEAAFTLDARLRLPALAILELGENPPIRPK